MQDPQSKEYFARRAEEERAAAERCADERAAQSHRDLAARYDQMAGKEADQSEKEMPEQTGILAADFRILP